MHSLSAGGVGRCQALWTPTREERYRPSMLAIALAIMGMAAAL